MNPQVLVDGLINGALIGLGAVGAALFGVVALVVVPPRDLPAVLRAAGRGYARLRRVQDQVRSAANEMMTDASLERELATLRGAASVALAQNPMTAMRGRLSASVAEMADALDFVTPEMQAYLAPPAAAEERRTAS